MKSNYKRIGDYIQEINVRNTELNVNNLLGINIEKFFMPSVANIVGTDMTRYKIVKNGQFACNRMHVGRDKRLPVALLKQVNEAIVSPAYNVFEVIEKEALIPEYLMMWFSRKEFDRNAWFYTDADVRGGLNWKDFCNMQIPVPSISKQKEIVKEYNVLVDRIKLNNRLVQKVEETAQDIYKQWFVDFEFPNENDYPYKSNGGDLDNIYTTNLTYYIEHSKETINPSVFPDELFSHYSIPAYDDNALPKLELGNEIKSNKYIVKDNSILISKLNPNFSRVWNLYGKVEKNSICSTEFQVLIPRNEAYFGFIFFYLKSNSAKEILVSMATGTSNSHQRVKPDNLLDMPMFKFDDFIIEKFNFIIIPFIKILDLKREENANLEKLKKLLLSKLATIGG